MIQETVLKPRLIGRRFDKHAIPMDILKDLTVLEPFIIEVAKWLFLKEHPDRKRVPRGFTKGISLKLTKIDEGSAVPNLALECRQDKLIQTNLSYFESAPREIIKAIDAVNNREDVLQYLPAPLLSYFDLIGRSLRDDEVIEFQPVNNSVTSVRFDKITRRRLIDLSSSANSFTNEVEVYGYIPEVDQDKMTFELQTIGGIKVKSPLAPPYLDDILEAFNGYKLKTKVLIKGIARFNRYERMERIESIDLVTLLDPLDIGARLEEIRELKQGWYNGKGNAFDYKTIVWFKEIMEFYYPDDFASPYIYPTPEGNLLLEWDSGNYDISLEIDLSSKNGWLHILNIVTEEDSENSFNFGNPKDMKKCFDTLKKYFLETKIEY